MNPEAEGTVYPEVAFVVEPERVAAFRAVFGQDEGVPPTFLTAAEFAVLPRVIADPRLGLDFTRVLHATQEYVYERPVRVGETLTVRARIDGVKRKGINGFLTVVMEFLDDDGALVATARSVMVERGADG
ncbi:MAG: MaoC family dehydratase N-terminal domain-containing protein [Planctomycetaceae bacterium]